MPAPASTATTRLARRSRETSAEIPSIVSRRWCAPWEGSSVSGPWRFRTCRRRVALGPASGFRAGVQRRHRRDRAGAGEQPLRRRDRQLLQPAAMARLRRRCLVVAGPFHRITVPAATTCPKRSASSCRRALAWTTSMHAYASVRLRYFGSRALVEDNSVRSQPTTPHQRARRLRFRQEPASSTADVFNLFDAKVSDIDYYFTSRLPGEPLAGVDDIHFHPAVPRTLRVSMVIGFR